MADREKREMQAAVAARRSWLECTDRLNLGKWYWIRRGVYPSELTPPPWLLRLQDSLDDCQLGVTRYTPGKVLDTFGGRVLVGHAGEGSTEWVKAVRVVRQLEPIEMSQHLRAEPVHREWPTPDLVPAEYRAGD